jgi:hypothetical protein
MNLRQSAWRQLVSQGFRYLLVGRQGSALSSGEDTELCCALILSGWKLWYEPRLRLQHCIPASRLQWSYLRRLRRGFGAASVGLDAYDYAREGLPPGVRRRIEPTWQWQAMRTLRLLLRFRHKWALARQFPMEGDPDILRIEHLQGRLSELLRRRSDYDQGIREVYASAWARGWTCARPVPCVPEPGHAVEHTA